MHMQCGEHLQKDTKDSFLLGLLAACSSCTADDNMISSYHLLDCRSCRHCFEVVIQSSKKVIDNIHEHLTGNRFLPREHGNKRNQYHAFGHGETEFVVNFLTTFANSNAVVHPVIRTEQPTLYLPSLHTKQSIYNTYVEMCHNHEAVGKSTFFSLWEQYVPHIRISSPRCDVCTTCEKFRDNIRSNQDNEEIKGEFQQHLSRAEIAKNFYNQQCDNDYHLTFDFSQFFLLPHYSRQVSNLYFLSSLKCYVFGIVNECLGKQHNFMYSEGQCIGTDGAQCHTPNAVVSMLYWYLRNILSPNQKSLLLHADNCCAQNKNRTVLAFLSWLVFTGQYNHIELTFQIPGHTRSRVDSGFGHIRKLFNQRDTSSYLQLQDVIVKSSKTNLVTLYPQWQWLDFDSFLQLYKRLPGITKYHHFVFDSEQIHVVHVKMDTSDANYSVFHLLNNNANNDNLHQIQNMEITPNIITSSGMSSARLQYLTDKILPFVHEKDRDNFLVFN